MINFTDPSWRTIFLILGMSAILLLTVQVPIIWKIALMCSLTLMVLLEILKLTLWVGFEEERKIRDHVGLSTRPLVSIHLAIYNEPPELVIKTIKALLVQDYPNFEVIVVDNNTKDRKVWDPVRSFCQDVPNVRFFHLARWPFFKSGALNFARKVTNVDTDFIFVVDADYILCTDALHTAVANIESDSIALIQFPQAYICNERKYLPIVEEFDHFFDFYCYKANSCYGALATGTLSLIRIAALDKVGGWPTDSITEDAELGVRLQTAGFDIKYVHKVIGKGIVPIRQRDFIQQRRRWIFGNIQTLLKFSVNPLKNFPKWISGVSQLTAWINLLGLPILGLLCCLVASPLMDLSQLLDIATLCYCAIWLFIITKTLQFLLVDRSRPLHVLKALMLHFAVLDIAAFYWWPVLFGAKRPFKKTDKSGAESSYRINLFYPILHFLLLILFLFANSWILAVSATFLLIIHLIAISIDFSCRTESGRHISYNLKLQL